MFDGSIRIDTRIDSKGMTTGVKKITSIFGSLAGVIKGIGKLLVTAFVGGSIINGIKGILGNFDLLGSSIGDKIKPLTDAFAVLKGTFVNLIATALVPMIPYLVMAVQWFTKMLTTATQIIAALFGMRQTTGAIATNTKKTAKEARGALAAFDQINVLQQDTAGAGEETPMLTPPPVAVTDEIFDKVQKVKQWFIDLWNGIKEGATKAWGWIKETFGPAVEWIKQNIVDPIVNWIKENPEKFKTFAIILGIVVVALLLFVGVMGLISLPVLIVILVIGLLIGILVNLYIWWNVLKEQGPKVWQAIRDACSVAVSWFTMNVWEPIKEGFTKAFNFIKEKFTFISSAFNIVKIAYGAALNWIYDKFVSIFTSIGDFVRGITNNIIDFINSMIGGVVGGINAMVQGVNTIGGVIGIPPMSFVSAPQIPRLATGAVIPANSEFLAVLGDQRSGRNIEAPESLIRQIIQEELKGISQSVTVDMPVYLDGEKVYQNQKKVAMQHGKNLISAGAV